jgi:hypothetical protein
VSQFEYNPIWQTLVKHCDQWPTVAILTGMTKHPKRPRDPNRLAKLIVDLATGTVEEDKPVPDSPRVAASRKGGSKGGPARSVKLTDEQRSAIARKAAHSRWHPDK